MSVDGDDKCPPDGVRPEATVFEMLRCYRHFLWGSFEFGQFTDQFQQTGAVFANGPADGDRVHSLVPPFYPGSAPGESTAESGQYEIIALAKPVFPIPET